mmetsp:Transcript_20643/g.29634  ORF Transcript_20643/g.29634 Transcript_20643/m.29634 type:complete len:95 (-) Transcript_20643:1421-1705(-)
MLADEIRGLDSTIDTQSLPPLVHKIPNPVERESSVVDVDAKTDPADVLGTGMEQKPGRMIWEGSTEKREEMKSTAPQPEESYDSAETHTLRRGK